MARQNLTVTSHENEKMKEEEYQLHVYKEWITAGWESTVGEGERSLGAGCSPGAKTSPHRRLTAQGPIELTMETLGGQPLSELSVAERCNLPT